MRRPRFTIQRLMIVVAAVAALLGGAIQARTYLRVYSLNRQAASYASQERYWMWRVREAAKYPDAARENAEIARLAGARKRIYQRAAAHPDEPLPPLPGR